MASDFYNIKAARVECATPRCAFRLNEALIGGTDEGIFSRDETVVWKAMGKTVSPLLEGGHYFLYLGDRPQNNTSLPNIDRTAEFLGKWTTKDVKNPCSPLIT